MPNFVTFRTIRVKGWDKRREEDVLHEEKKITHEKVARDLELDEIQKKKYYDKKRDNYGLHLPTRMRIHTVFHISLL
jgi:hypothetical protein